MTQPLAPAHIVRALLVTPSPWSNGGGRTRVLALGPMVDDVVGGAAAAGRDASGPLGGLRWRLSLAELDGNADFSALPGVDRVFTLASAGPIALTVDGVEHRVRRGQPTAFGGEATVAVRLPRGGRELALNLMTRRGAGEGAVEVLEATGEVRLDPAEGHVAAVVLAGGAVLVGADLAGGEQLGPLTAVVLGGGEELLRCEGALVARVAVAAR